MGIKQVVNRTMTDNEVVMVSFGQDSASIQLLSVGDAVVSLVGSNLGESVPTILSLDDSSTTITLADGVAQIVDVNLSVAHFGVKKISGPGVITAVISAPGI